MDFRVTALQESLKLFTQASKHGAEITKVNHFVRAIQLYRDVIWMVRHYWFLMQGACISLEKNCKGWTVL